MQIQSVELNVKTNNQGIGGIVVVYFFIDGDTAIAEIGSDHHLFFHLKSNSMKKARITLLSFVIATSALLSFKNSKPASIKGKVTPAFYGVNAWAISGTDTLYTSISDGSFEFPNAEPGVYRIVIEARSPYRNMAKDGITVKDGQAADIGELPLQKWESAYATSSK